MTNTDRSTDPALWTTRRAFGVAGGPDKIVLTDEGRERAFSVGAKVRRGATAKALEALWSTQGEGHLSVRGEGARIKRTDLGRFDQVAWCHLKARGLVESFQDSDGDGVRLTEAGKRAAWEGVQERERLLARCRQAAAVKPGECGAQFTGWKCIRPAGHHRLPGTPDYNAQHRCSDGSRYAAFQDRHKDDAGTGGGK